MQHSDLATMSNGWWRLRPAGKSTLSAGWAGNAAWGHAAYSGGRMTVDGQDYD